MVDLINASSCAIFSFNDEGALLQVNDALCTLLKAEKEHLLQQKVASIFTVPTHIFFQTHMYPLLKVGNSLEEMFVTLKTSAGRQVPVILSARRIVGDGTVENVCSCLTVYNRKNYEDEILQAKRDAEKALQENSALVTAQQDLQEHVKLLDEQMFLLQQYNETLKEISYAVSHELQEPVRKLNLFSDLLLNRGETILTAGSEKKITGQVDRITEILKGLQSYIWLEDASPNRGPVALNDALKKAEQTWVTENPHLHFTLSASDLPVVNGDAAQFQMLFYQLFSNAGKFRSAERPLHISVETTIINRNQFKLLQNHYTYRAYHKIDFGDNGMGFPADYEAYIFQLFKKLNSNAQGLGVGLTLCRRIVLNHNGLMTATSTEGKSSTFTILLPVDAG